MAKRLISINLDDDLIQAIDDLSESVGMSRSAMVNLVMRGTIMGETSDTAALLLQAALSVKKPDESAVDASATA